MLEELGRLFTDIPFNRLLGLTVESLDEDKAVMRFSMKNELIGNYMHGILHGGVISSVIDMGGGLAAIAAAARKYQDKTPDEMQGLLSKSSTINLHINYICPGKGNLFSVVSKVVRMGNKICFTQSELLNEKATLIAAGSATYLIG